MPALQQYVSNLDHRIQLVMIGLIVGVFSGFAALGLNFALESFPRWLTGFSGPAVYLVLPAVGILLTVLFLRYLVRDRSGHGVPEVIYSVGARGGRMPKRAGFSRLVASFLTISSGGSAGPEAPVVFSGAAIGSSVAAWLRTNERIHAAATGSGAAAAIAAIFNAPVTGIIFTMEVILGEWAPVSMLPVAIASVTGTEISRMFNGNRIPFRHQSLHVAPTDIFAVAFMSLLVALFVILFIRTLKKGGSGMAAVFPNPLLRAAVGGLLVGGAVFAFPAVRGEGYHLVRSLLDGGMGYVLPMLGVLVVMKIAATALTLGSGGSGGVFAPSLVIGALTGFLFHGLMTMLFPDVGFAAAPLYILAGMAGTLSGTLGAPLTGIFLIVEITGGYDVILPLLVVSFLTYTLVRLAERHSIYQYELAEKGLLLRPRTDARILTDIPLLELLERDLVPVHPDMPLSALIPRIRRSRRNHFPVEEPKSGEFLGMVNFADMKEFLFDAALARTVLVEEVMHADGPVVDPGQSLPRVLEVFDRTGEWSLPVVEGGRFLGLISKSTLLDHYRKELKAQTEI